MYNWFKVWKQQLFSSARLAQNRGEEDPYPDDKDPRELPRPDPTSDCKVKITKICREISDYETTKTGSQTKEEKLKIENSTELSASENNKIVLEELSECFVCTEALQGLGVCSCSVCGNVWCTNCSVLLTNCPFCRVTLTGTEMIRNKALERLLMNFNLPCRNHRWGCPILVKGETRTLHELICDHKPLNCPLDHFCKWKGLLSDISSHLRNAHNLAIVAANGIHLEISDFSTKVKRTKERGRRYVIALDCHKNVYICKITLHKCKLKLSFQQINENCETVTRKVKAYVEVKNDDRYFSFNVPVSDKKQKEIIVPSEEFTTDIDKTDFVSITVTIRTKYI